MATTPETATEPNVGAPSELQHQARRHLWMHFTRMGAYDDDHRVPILVRGEGCYVWDEEGNRYLDGLSSLFCVSSGHGRTELGDAAARQSGELGFWTNWSYAHPPAIELATRLADLAPGDLNRVFFTSGGSEAVETAWKLARNYHRVKGEGTRTKIVAREIAYHGTSMGALSATGITSLRSQFEPLLHGCHVPNTNSYRWPEDRDPLWAADQIEERILFEDPETVAAVILEPVQNGGGCFPPQDGYFQRVREICDRYGVLMISDEVICAMGRLGHYFGCERYGYQPDIVTCAKALTSAYAPMGAMICTDRVAEPFIEDPMGMFAHGFTFGGHPMACAIAMANLDIYEREDLCGQVRAKEGEFRAMLERIGEDLPIVGDVRGAGFFQALELVKDKGTKESFDDDESEELLRGFLSGELYRQGLICRADDRGDPVIQLAPPLIADTEQFEEIDAVLRSVLAAAWDRIVRH